MPETEILAMIEAPHFFVGIVLRNNRVIEAAPIVKYMKGWTRAQVRDYCVKKDWEVSIIWIRGGPGD